jgi:transcriptional regulator with XRE-family HTH domain
MHLTTVRPETLPYNPADTLGRETDMPKRTMGQRGAEESFGERLARLRQAAGYSQRELAAELGISQRMVAYYEGETEYPPAHLLPVLAQTLAVSTDQLLGVAPAKANGRGQDTRLWRRFRQIEKLPPAERKPIIQVLDAFLAKSRAE